MKVTRFRFKDVVYWGKVSDDGEMIYSNLSMLRDVSDFAVVMDYFGQENVDELLVDQVGLTEVTRLAPVLPTKNVLCIGKNYHDHILEFDGSAEDIENVKENPIFFSKALSSIIGPDEKIKLHGEVAKEVDYEAELAVIIGKTCYNVSEDEAMDYVYGYTCLNDVTARDLQRTHQQWHRGKSLDTHCPIGPYLVLADESIDPQKLAIKSIINGEVRQNANTELMIHSIASQISTLSKGMTLNPGDVIATGTPKGVGMGFDPPKLLKAGDQVVVEIEGLGRLVNVCE